MKDIKAFFDPVAGDDSFAMDAGQLQRDVLWKMLTSMAETIAADREANMGLKPGPTTDPLEIIEEYFERAFKTPEKTLRGNMCGEVLDAYKIGYQEGRNELIPHLEKMKAELEAARKDLLKDEDMLARNSEPDGKIQAELEAARAENVRLKKDNAALHEIQEEKIHLLEMKRFHWEQKAYNLEQQLEHVILYARDENDIQAAMIEAMVNKLAGDKLPCPFDDDIDFTGCPTTDDLSAVGCRSCIESHFHKHTHHGEKEAGK